VEISTDDCVRDWGMEGAHILQNDKLNNSLTQSDRERPCSGAATLAILMHMVPTINLTTNSRPRAIYTPNF